MLEGTKGSDFEGGCYHGKVSMGEGKSEIEVGWCATRVPAGSRRETREPLLLLRACRMHHSAVHPIPVPRPVCCVCCVQVTFPPQYPFKPPSIVMLTPNGRFATNTKLCLRWG